MHAKPQTAALSILLAVALMGCDKKTPKPVLTQIAPGTLAASDAPDSAKELHSEWKASDIHTHLSPAAYPLAVRAMDTSRILRVVNMSGGSTPEFRRANLNAADAYPGRIALFFNLDWQRVNAPDFGKMMAEELEAAVHAGYTGIKIAKHLGLGARDADGNLIA